MTEKRELDIKALQQSGMTREASERIVARMEADRDKAATIRRLEAENRELAAETEKILAQLAVLVEALKPIHEVVLEMLDYGAEGVQDELWWKLLRRASDAYEDISTAAKALLDELAELRRSVSSHGAVKEE